jgi:hypothetical protein
MKHPMEGMRIVEVAQYAFVPSSGGVLAERGADDIKVEHAVTGDAMRGLVRLFGMDVADDTTSFFPIMEGPNRARRSVGIALEVQRGQCHARWRGTPEPGAAGRRSAAQARAVVWQGPAGNAKREVLARTSARPQQPPWRDAFLRGPSADRRNAE